MKHSLDISKLLAAVACVSLLALPFTIREARADAGKRDGVVGCWKTIDDKTKTPKSIVKIWKKDDKVYGRILRLFRKPPEVLDPVCDKCQGDRKNKRVIGMQILWDLKPKSYWWHDGKILDPANGKTYRAEIWLAKKGADSSMLRVRGILAIFYRTQTWHRATCPKGPIPVKGK